MKSTTMPDLTVKPGAELRGATRTAGPRRLIVLGSTGSIGVNTLKVVEHLNAVGRGGDSSGPGPVPGAGANPGAFEVVGLAAGRGVELLVEQARRFAVRSVAIADSSLSSSVQKALPEARVFFGPEAAQRLVEETEATDVSAAIVGSAGLGATLAAVRKGLRIGLANKETLVAAGELVTPLVRSRGATLIPVDSEHSAIFQCLHGQTQGRAVGCVKKIVLTASGGPFRKVDKAAMDAATVEQALNHPTWNMGPKITIDSATMMNKALEVIEAHWLFGLPAEKIEVMIHPQSMIHSFVEFNDHSVLAQLGPPDMRTPIQHALEYPHRGPGCSHAMDWSKLSKLEFEVPDREKFRSLDLAYEVIAKGGTAGAVLNAANEAAVAAFLERKIPFGRIVELSAAALEGIPARPVESLETIMEADRQARAFVQGRIAGLD